MRLTSIFLAALSAASIALVAPAHDKPAAEIEIGGVVSGDLAGRAGGGGGHARERKRRAVQLDGQPLAAADLAKRAEDGEQYKCPPHNRCKPRHLPHGIHELDARRSTQYEHGSTLADSHHGHHRQHSHPPIPAMEKRADLPTDFDCSKHRCKPHRDPHGTHEYSTRDRHHHKHDGRRHHEGHGSHHRHRRDGRGRY